MLYNTVVQVYSYPSGLLLKENVMIISKLLFIND